MTIVDERETSKENIDSILNLIYNMGDQDECSDMHLGHCLAAIASGQTHREVVVYDNYIIYNICVSFIIKTFLHL